MTLIEGMEEILTPKEKYRFCIIHYFQDFLWSYFVCVAGVFLLYFLSHTRAVYSGERERDVCMSHAYIHTYIESE